MNKKTKEDNHEQSKRFIETAKSVGADESKEGADRVFKKAASFKPVRKGEKKDGA